MSRKRKQVSEEDILMRVFVVILTVFKLFVWCINYTI